MSQTTLEPVGFSTMRVSIVCKDCGVTFEQDILAAYPNWRPTCCLECSDKHIERAVDRETIHRCYQIADANGIEKKFRLYNGRKDACGYLPWIRANKERSIYLQGSYQTGKTHAVLYCAWRMLLNHHKSISVAFLPAWMRRLSTLAGDNGRGAHDLIYQVSRVDLFILDDLGKERLSEYQAEALFEILDTRERRGLQTWITSNASLAEIEKRLGPDRGAAIISRINRAFAIFEPRPPPADWTQPQSDEN